MLLIPPSLKFYQFDPNFFALHSVVSHGHCQFAGWPIFYSPRGWHGFRIGMGNSLIPSVDDCLASFLIKTTNKWAAGITIHMEIKVGG